VISSILIGVAFQEVVLRPPSVPLVACDPYFSIWSPYDKLNEGDTVHWTGAKNRLQSTIKIDGKDLVLMGKCNDGNVPMGQTLLKVLPTRTLYRFESENVRVDLTFTTPSIPWDIDLLSRPITFLDYEIVSKDQKPHDFQLSLQVGSEIARHSENQELIHEFGSSPALKVAEIVSMRAGTQKQEILRRTGDFRRIDWGHVIVATSQSNLATFVSTGDKEHLFLSPVWNGRCSGKPTKIRALLAYDDDFSIQYFNKNLRPFWKRSNKTWEQLVIGSLQDGDKITQACEKFDEELMRDLKTVGGDKYAQLCALAFRQCFAGNKIAADANGQPLIFPKENTSNGCIGTVDVIFPMSPQYLLFGPSLTKAMIVSNLDYGSSDRWKFPFAPHDLGTYPKANGQVYGGGELTEENQMPVEETGNMLILCHALAKMENSTAFLKPYEKMLRKWAEFLKSKGYDPENQLSTDDFMGHLKSQTNLSIKAILALGSYAEICKMNGKSSESSTYRKLAEEYAQKWVKEASDGDHFRLTFDRSGTWGQKYNLVWDRLLDLNLFPKSVGEKEMSFYKKVVSPFGLALDSRQNAKPSKIDWTLWTATLTGKQDDFEALLNPTFRYVNETPNRVGIGDLYDCTTGRHIGMHSRPVVGGFFLKMLYDSKIWKKYASRDQAKSKNWAPLPSKPIYVSVLPTSEVQSQSWKFTLTEPNNQIWMQSFFLDSDWKEGMGPFAAPSTPGIKVGTSWQSSNIWLRKEFNFEGSDKNLLLRFYHDEDIEVFLNGVLVYSAKGFTTQYDTVSLPEKLLNQGKNFLAVHCRQTNGGQGVDVGIVKVKTNSKSQ
jgi:hypothetical protein